jgi:hypothetical protein
MEAEETLTCDRPGGGNDNVVTDGVADSCGTRFDGW